MALLYSGFVFSFNLFIVKHIRFLVLSLDKRFIIPLFLNLHEKEPIYLTFYSEIIYFGLYPTFIRPIALPLLYYLRTNPDTTRAAAAAVVMNGNMEEHE